MKRNEISENAHKNAVEHGFWDVRKSNEHCLMLVITEISEMVEADRNGKFANQKSFEAMIEMPHRPYDTEFNIWKSKFEGYIKNTLEDELADVAIRLGDLAGSLGVDFDRLQPCRYYRAFDRFSFTENAFALVKGLSKDMICIEKRIQFGLFYIEEWSKHLGINLDWHIEQKMKYNQGREAMHGKKY